MKSCLKHPDGAAHTQDMEFSKQLLACASGTCDSDDDRPDSDDDGPDCGTDSVYVAKEPK